MSQHQNKQVKLQELEPPLPKASLFIWIICIGLLVLLAWAWLFKLEEVSTGTGKVVPSSKEQIIQSLEGGILTKLNVREGEVVQSYSSAPACRSEWRIFEIPGRSLERAGAGQ